MEINSSASTALINELTNLNVVVIFSDTVEKYSVTLIPNEEGKEEIRTTTEFRPFSISINDEFKSNHRDSGSDIDQNYGSYVQTLSKKVIEEIDSNINLRIGKWDILNYLNNLEFELKEIRNHFYIIDQTNESEEGGVKKINLPYPFDLEDSSIFYNRVEIEYWPKEDDKFPPSNKDLFHAEYTLCGYWVYQIHVIDRITKIILQRASIIEKTDDYVKAINNLPSQNAIQWTKTDTDLLELIIALHEAGAIQNATKDLTQKEAIQSFSEFFGKEIKDQYKKLNAARNRKKEDPGFIPKIQRALESYYQALNERD